MPEILGVLETALYVEDLDRSERFYVGLFGFKPLTRSERVCALGVAGRDVLLLFAKRATRTAIETDGGVIPPHDADGQMHLAFGVDRDSLEGWERRLAARSIPIESRMRWARGGHSLYFRDPDGHLVELASRGTWSIF